MEDSLAKECKKWLEEREKCCYFCGFNYNGRKADLIKDCLANKCKYLTDKMRKLKPYYEAKESVVLEPEKSVNEQLAERQKYLYDFYVDNCIIDTEVPLSFDAWLLYRDKERDRSVIPADKVNSKEDYEKEDFIR